MELVGTLNRPVYQILLGAGYRAVYVQEQGDGSLAVLPDTQSEVANVFPTDEGRGIRVTFKYYVKNK